jgi:solute carrier family 1 (neuronal/epithelial high affinity glutamate transporter), member 1
MTRSPADTVDENKKFLANKTRAQQEDELERASVLSLRNKGVLQIFLSQVGENILLLSTIGAVILGVGLGFLLRNIGTFNDNHIMYFGFIGKLFLRMLKFLILPLIACSLISGIAGLGSGNAGKIAVRALVYYFSTTFIAVSLGVILVITIRPGVGKSASTDEPIVNIPVDTEKYVTTHDTILDLIRLIKLN